MGAIRFFFSDYSYGSYKNCPIIPMGAIDNSFPIRLVPTYILQKKADFWESFSPIALKTREESFSPIALKLRETSLCRKHADHEYIHFMGSETSLSLFHKLLTEIIILSARYKNNVQNTLKKYSTKFRTN